MVAAKSVILATGGIGRLHIQGFPTSNHYGATGDGLALAYRLGAKLLQIDTFQYHPSGAVFPEQLIGALVTEGINRKAVISSMPKASGSSMSWIRATSCRRPSFGNAKRARHPYHVGTCRRLARYAVVRC